MDVSVLDADERVNSSGDKHDCAGHAPSWSNLGFEREFAVRNIDYTLLAIISYANPVFVSILS
jgi:hypothetical protein